MPHFMRKGLGLEMSNQDIDKKVSLVVYSDESNEVPRTLARLTLEEALELGRMLISFVKSEGEI